MKAFHLKLWLATATLGLSAYAFSQLGTPPPDSTQPLAAAPNPVTPSPLNEGYFVANGASYYARNGQAVKVEREVSIRVTPTGIIGFDGQPLALAPGMMLTPDGRHAPIPAGINLQQPGNASPFPASPVEARRDTPVAPTPEPLFTPEASDTTVPVRQR